MLIVLTTTSSVEEAERIAKGLVQNKLAACVQIMPRMTSIYVWDGAIQTEPEHLLLIKTLKDKFEAVSAFLESEHSYDVPEIVAVDAANASEPYLKWVANNLFS